MNYVVLCNNCAFKQKERSIDDTECIRGEKKMALLNYEQAWEADASREGNNSIYDVFEECTVGDIEQYKEKNGILNLCITEEEMEECLSSI